MQFGLLVVGGYSNLVVIVGFWWFVGAPNPIALQFGLVVVGACSRFSFDFVFSWRVVVPNVFAI